MMMSMMIGLKLILMVMRMLRNFSAKEVQATLSLTF